jgi:UDPglucose 6-dehydrogenase
MKIAIVGYGYVGKAMFRFFSSKYECVWYDPFIEGSCSQSDVNSCDMSVLCVFTPSGADGSCDVSILEDVMSWVQTPLILIKSTIAPGTVDHLKTIYPDKHVCFSPEYIGESEYCTGKYDFNKEVARTDFVTVGGDSKDVDAIFSILGPLMGPNKRYLRATAREAEIAKYMENCFFASKLVFCYEFEQICRAQDVSYSAVRELWLADPRIGSSHTSVFSHNKAPFSGKCLPKDLAAIIHNAEDHGYNPVFLKEVKSSNDRIGDLR